MKSYIQAIKILKACKIKINDEIINVSDSLNRVSSTKIYANSDYPGANNASFDGFVIRSSDTNRLNKKNYKKFKIIGSIPAGSKTVKKKIKKFQAFEIMTGGIIPKSLNTIIPIEQIIFHPNRKKAKYIILNKKISKYKHIRFKGSDYKKKDLILNKGTILQPNHILALKTLGIQKISVETGAGEFFLPARKLFKSCGFEECEPFAHYSLDPNSCYYNLKI